MVKQTCRCCGVMKDITRFHKNGKQGRLHTCIDCRWEVENKKQHRFYLAHPEKFKEKRRKQYKENKQYYLEHGYRWREEHPERYRELLRRFNHKRLSTIKGNLSARMSNGIQKSLRRKKNGYHWEIIVGYNIEQLKQHLEKQFADGISWENYNKWHIDHIIPISFFRYSSFNDVEFKMCWRLENLRPLWARENIQKKNKIVRVA